VALLLLDLDDTIADREAAFAAWARVKAAQWAPDDAVASTWLHRGRAWSREDLHPDRVADDLVAALAMLPDA
jgi:hypothetical protein